MKPRRSSPPAPLASLAGLVAFAGLACGPADGVQSIAFLLETPPPLESRTFPPPEDLGADPFALRGARGRCDLTIASSSVKCVIEGLPPLPASGPGRKTYRLGFLVDDHAVVPGYDAVAVDRDPGGHDPDGPPPVIPPPLPRAAVAEVRPDAVGATQVSLSLPDLPLDRVVGGEIHLHAPRADGSEPRYLVLDGRVGNVVDGTTSGPKAPTTVPGGGHQH